jgi:predicted aldo/keto reductase-like oxidoreductase
MSSIAFTRGMVKRFPPETVFSGRMNELMATAANCTECGECEPRCPYHLPIREILKEELDWYRRQRKRWLDSQGAAKT